MKKFLSLIIDILILIVIMTSATIALRGQNNTKEGTEEGKIKIVTTIFPEYDFAKHIVGDKGEVSLLIKPGVETHNFEPTAQDIIDINNSDLLITIGEELSPWVKDLSKVLSKDVNIVNLSEGINLIDIEEFEEKYGLEDEPSNESESHHLSHDEHIWLNLDNANIMIDNITNKLCDLDKENAPYYTQNATNYKNEINALKGEFEKLFKENQITLVFGGEFSYAYFVEEFGINFKTVYNNCGEGEDPSIIKVKRVIDYINDNDIRVVFYPELSNGSVAKMISEQTKAEAEILYSVHNGIVDGDNPDTYVSLMKKNYDNILKSINK